MSARQRNYYHHLGHQRQAYDHQFRNQDFRSWYDHKSIDHHRRHYQQDKRWLNDHGTSHQRIGYVLRKCRLVRSHANTL